MKTDKEYHLPKTERDLVKGLYFVHGSYISDHNRRDISNRYRDQMILVQDSFDSIYDINTYDVNLREMGINEAFPQGEYIYYDGKRFRSAEDDPTAIIHSELNRQLRESSLFSEPEKQEDSDTVSDVYSYHVNIGHGNCSIIVFKDNHKHYMWMVDCSVFDMINRQNYCRNLDLCLDDIKNVFGITRISKLLVTHLHYDHINGIQHLINAGWIDKDTEVWMNIKYPWPQATNNRLLLRLNALSVKFVDPICRNSTVHLRILYPARSFDKTYQAPKNNINNASIVYQICFNGQKMLFPGDIETEGWDDVKNCFPHLAESTFYCISHHGSITGHLRNGCSNKNASIKNLADCGSNTKVQILMGRNQAYRGIFSKKVLNDFKNIVKTEDAEHYIKLKWDTGIYTFC